MAVRPITQHRADRQVEVEEIDSGISASAARSPRYHIILRIRHPELDPTEITAALGWEPELSWKAGDQAVTPKGTKLAGVRRYGMWSRGFEFKGRANIAGKLDKLLDYLMEHKELFDRLARMQAQSALYLQMPGHTNNGDRIPLDILRKFVDLHVALEFEVFPNSP
jgi:hypothetical protein